MSEHFFLNPFALSGDRAAIPEGTQPDGSVSYENGFTVDYQLDQATDPDAKNIPRQKFNSLMFNVTEAIRQLQTASVPTFITTAANGGSPYSYLKGVSVMYDDGVNGNRIYESLVDSNTSLPTDATKWQLWSPTSSIPDASETVKGIIELATAAEIATGTDAVRAMTPAAFAAFKNLADSGYYQLPGGFLIQWGGVLCTAGNGIWTYPIAFPNKAFSVSACQHDQDIAYNVALTITASKTQAIAKSQHPGVDGFYCFAVGN